MEPDWNARFSSFMAVFLSCGLGTCLAVFPNVRRRIRLRYTSQILVGSPFHRSTSNQALIHEPDPCCQSLPSFDVESGFATQTRSLLVVLSIVRHQTRFRYANQFHIVSVSIFRHRTISSCRHFPSLGISPGFDTRTNFFLAVFSGVRQQLRLRYTKTPSPVPWTKTPIDACSSALPNGRAVTLADQKSKHPKHPRAVRTNAGDRARQTAPRHRYPHRSFSEPCCVV